MVGAPYAITNHSVGGDGIMKKISSNYLGIAVLFAFSSAPHAQTTTKPEMQRGPVQLQRATPVAAGPDLVIESVQGVPDAITSPDGFGPIFFATITIRNRGNADAWFPPNSWIIGGPSQYTNISAPGKITNSQTSANTAIRPGQTWSATLAGKASCLRGDPIEVRFQVDPQNRVQETNENNNEWKKLVANRAVPGQNQQPDVVIESVSFRPPNPTHYDRVMIDVKMRNVGAGPAVFCEHDLIWMSQIEGANGGGGGAGDRVVKPNEEFMGGLNIVEPNTMQKGCYRVRVTVDPRNAIVETNENNNMRVGYLSMEGGDCAALVAEDRKFKQGPQLVVPGAQPLLPAGAKAKPLPR
jgi:CARDB protein